MSQVIIGVLGTPQVHHSVGANQDTTVTQSFTAATYAAVTVPTGAIGVLIVPDNANTGTITMKGVTGDTGINIRKSKPSYHSLDEAGASFGILCANSISITFIFA